MPKKRGIGQDIISLRKAGRTYSQIAKELSCSKNTVNYHCKKVNLEDIGFKNVKISKKIAEEILDFFKDSTNTIKKASEHFDLSFSTIKKYKKGGVFPEENEIEKESHDE